MTFWTVKASRFPLARCLPLPSITGVPASLTITGATASTVPYRFDTSHAMLRITGTVAVVGPGTGTGLEPLDLAQLGRLDRAILAKGFDSIEFQLRWQRLCEAIEAAVNSLNTQVNDNTALLSRIAAAQSLAQAANDNATTVDNRTSIESSYTDPTNILTASADGTITIAAHTRRYTNGTSASISAGSVSGLTNEVTYTVYYVDAAREGGTVTFFATTSAVAQTGNTHIVGTATIPATGQPPAGGTSPTAPGYTPPPGDSNLPYLP